MPHYGLRGRGVLPLRGLSVEFWEAAEELREDFREAEEEATRLEDLGAEDFFTVGREEDFAMTRRDMAFLAVD